MNPRRISLEAYNLHQRILRGSPEQILQWAKIDRIFARKYDREIKRLHSKFYRKKTTNHKFAILKNL